jgi:hypothetical protein
MTVASADRIISAPGRLWRDHEEGVLYAVAVAVYIPAGVFLKTIVLNWVVGLLFPVLVVHVLPAGIRRVWGKR